MLTKLSQSEKLRALETKLRNGDSILVEELWNAPKALMASLAQQATGKHILILTGAGVEEARLFHDLSFFSDRPIMDYPSWETLPSEKVAPSPDIVGERYQTLHAVHHSKEPHIIISSLQAALQKVILPSYFNSLYLKLETGQTVDFEMLLFQLSEMGYLRCPVASDKGEFAVRGGIVDIYPVSHPDPIRIEFFGDEITSMRLFDPIGQKSVRPIHTVDITPAHELELLSKTKEMGSLLDYLGKETIIIFDDLLQLEDRYASLVNLGSRSPYFLSIEEFLDQTNPFQKIFWSAQPIEELSALTHRERKRGAYSANVSFSSLTFELFQRKFEVEQWRSPLIPIGQYLFPEAEEVEGDQIITALGKLFKSGCTLHILSDTELEETHFHKRILEQNIQLPAETHFHIGYLSSGFVIHDTTTIVLPLTELTHHYKMRRQKLRSTFHTPPSELFELSEGELVVHLNHGIGTYMGIEKKIDHTGKSNEFMIIEYAKEAKLFVPIQQSHLVTKYIGAKDEMPKVHILGSKRWARARATTEKAIVGYASDLLNFYAKRSICEGFAFPEDSIDYRAFENEFPFVETEDQLRAIAEIKEDMQTPKAMDRLVCGDVGYGKTEVAMRAAFKAVYEAGKQVAVLVPTTVLSMQHFDNFIERMRFFPINIAVLSRFRTPKQVKETLKGIADGSVDILIGTHRIVSPDVKFHDLGLVVIDEEHRFGVRTKEHLKKIKDGVDCITLSATPIPRSLYMSLIEVRDMSVINTPPHDRLPIKTVIAEPNQELIKGALLRELARDGQVFYIHNRVETIYQVADRLQKLLPEAKILVGHGQMGAHELDTIFHTFRNGEADILVSTTIVENGVDIPNANTIIIERADRFGLAELYQLRGRVGRWNKRAYAYFLIPREASLNAVARKRLLALAESSGYGGGMKLAMRDLEIRGAGDILGTEQSGQVSSVGFHLYCKLLKRAIKRLQGAVPRDLCDTKMEFPFDARLPEDYVNATSLRMEFYQRFADCVSFEEVDQIWEELLDRFGTPPEPAIWLYQMAKIRVAAAQKGIKQVKFTKKTVMIDGKLTPLGQYTTAEELEAKFRKALQTDVGILGTPP